MKDFILFFERSAASERSASQIAASERHFYKLFKEDYINKNFARLYHRTSITRFIITA